MGKVTKVHEQALTASTTEALMAVYDDWAANYDHDLMDNWGYSTPARVADFLKRYLTVDDALILDAGCGTGLVGTALVANGLSRPEGLDVSQSMLHEAAKKAIYTQLHCADMNQPLPLASASFDGVTCVGTFTSAHVRPEALRELVRLTRPGGVVCFSVRTEYWEATKFRGLLTGMDSAGEVILEELRTEPYVDSEASWCKLVVLRVPLR